MIIVISQLLYLMTSACPIKCDVCVSIESGSHYAQLRWTWRFKKEQKFRSVDLMICDLDNGEKLISAIQAVKEMTWTDGGE